MRPIHFALLLAATLLTACASAPSGKPEKPGDRSSLVPADFEPDMFDRLTASGWTLVSIQNSPVVAPPASDSRRPGISFSRGGGVTGFAGVNSFSGRTDAQELAKGRLDLATLASTLMAGPTEAMRRESDYLGALHRARSYTISGQTLTLRDGAGAPLLTFRRD